jgi:L-amino acid N-acyltransferase YncA
MSKLEIRPLEAPDLPQVAEIFNYYVLNTTYSFHIGALDLDAMNSKTGLDRETGRSFGLFNENDLIGYSVLNPWKAPQAYRRSAEISIYLHPERVSSGYGLRLLEHTESAARQSDIRMLVAGICTENERSTRFFERAGYERCARFRSIGEKFGRELDVIYLQKQIL